MNGLWARCLGIIIGSCFFEIQAIAHNRGELSRLSAAAVIESPSDSLRNSDDATLLFPQQLAAQSGNFLAAASTLARGTPQSHRLHGNLSQRQMDLLIRDKLSSSYEKLSRPIPDCSSFDCTHRIKIRMGLSFRKLISLDQTTGTLNMVISLRLTWPDYRLAYNASDYFEDVPIFGVGDDWDWDSDTDFIPVDYHAIWLPDVQVLDAVEEPKVINHSPRVSWYDAEKLRKYGYNMVMEIPQVITTDCPMNLKQFPFDTQTCHLEFGDWTASKRFFEFDTVQHGEYEWDLPSKSKEFECMKVDIVRRDKVYHMEDKGLFPLVDYVLHLKRLPHYYLLQFVLPQCLLVLIGQGIYWMHLDRERHSTAITVVLAVMTVSFLTASMLPETNEVMWLEKFQIGCYILTCLPVFTSMLLDNARSGGFVPRHWLDHADALCRVVHPLCVFIFYAYVIFFSDVQWPGSATSQLDLVAFGGFNLLVYIIFTLSGFWNYYKFMLSQQRAPSEEEVDETTAATVSVQHYLEAVDALRRALDRK